MVVEKKIKGKKKWFTVIAPQLFNSKEIADIPAYNIDELQGRFVEVAGQMLTGLPKDASRKYLLQITNAKGDKVETTPATYYLTESFIQRFAKRYKERFICVLILKTKNDRQVKLKYQFLGLKKLHRTTRGLLLKKTGEFTRAALADLNSTELFAPATLDRISSELKKQLASIHTIDKILVTKLSISA